MVTPNIHFGFQQHLLTSSFPQSRKPRKNAFELVGTIPKKIEVLGPSRNAQNVCALTKGGTILIQNMVLQ